MGGLVQCHDFACPSGTECQDIEDGNSNCVEISKGAMRGGGESVPVEESGAGQKELSPLGLRGQGQEVTWWEGILGTMTTVCPFMVCVSLSVVSILVHFCDCDKTLRLRQEAAWGLRASGSSQAHSCSTSLSLWGGRGVRN